MRCNMVAAQYLINLENGIYKCTKCGNIHA